MRSWVLYTLARLGIFAGVLAALLLLGLEWWLAAILATVIALLISYLALARLRAQVAEQLATRGEQRRGPSLAQVDADDEDAEIDGRA